MARAGTRKLVVCVDNGGYPVSLEMRKIYVAIADKHAEERGLRRIIDESGEEYLHPADLFCTIELPQSVKKAVLSAA